MTQSTLPSEALGQLAQVLQQLSASQPAAAQMPYDRNETPLGSVVISGTGLGLPGQEKSVMDPDNALRILRGEQFVDLIPERFRNLMVDKQITRIVKGEDGSGRFETISDPAEVIKLAGRPGPFDLSEEYGVPQFRRRLVLLASKLGELKVPRGRYRSESRWKTVRETIEDLPPLKSGEEHPKDRLHVASKLSDLNLRRITVIMNMDTSMNRPVLLQGWSN